jgi:hypothetical protein
MLKAVACGAGHKFHAPAFVTGSAEVFDFGGSLLLYLVQRFLQHLYAGADINDCLVGWDTAALNLVKGAGE